MVVLAVTIARPLGRQNDPNVAAGATTVTAAPAPPEWLLSQVRMASERSISQNDATAPIA